MAICDEIGARPFGHMRSAYSSSRCQSKHQEGRCGGWYLNMYKWEIHVWAAGGQIDCWPKAAESSAGYVGRIKLREMQHQLRRRTGLAISYPLKYCRTELASGKYPSALADSGISFWYFTFIMVACIRNFIIAPSFSHHLRKWKKQKRKSKAYIKE